MDRPSGSTCSSGKSGIPRLPGKFRRPLSFLTKTFSKSKLRHPSRSNNFPAQASHHLHPPQPSDQPAQPQPSPCIIEQLPESLVAMTIARHDSLFTTDIAECGPQGIPPHPSGGHPYTQDELRKAIANTTFTVKVTSKDTAHTWITWLVNLGDDNCQYLRDLEIQLPATGMLVQLRIVPPKHTTPRVEFQVSFEQDLKIGVEVVKDEQFRETILKAAQEHLFRVSEGIRSRQLLLFGPGPLSKRELNKIAKAVFRLPAALHQARINLERGQNCGGREGDVDMTDESAIEDSDEEQEYDLLDHLRGVKRDTKAVSKQKVNGPPTVKDLFDQQEKISREHAQTCKACDCRWIAELDAHPDVHSFGLDDPNSRKPLFLLKSSNKAGEAQCRETYSLIDAETIFSKARPH